jgi:hypothetical protein
MFKKSAIALIYHRHQPLDLVSIRMPTGSDWKKNIPNIAPSFRKVEEIGP